MSTKADLKPVDLVDVSIIIVTYNSRDVIFECLNRLVNLRYLKYEVIVVDSASSDVGYLDEIERLYPFVDLLRLPKNVGFSSANNAGFRQVSLSAEYIVFLNPDAFVDEDLLTSLRSRMQNKRWEKVGICTPLLLGYSLSDGGATGLIDSAGIKKTWFGRFYDRGQGVVNTGQFNQEENMDAICGAFMFCRKGALDQISVNGSVFDESFFMYKEDIELSLRIRRAGWVLRFCPDLTAFHCRGWNSKRSEAQAWAIYHSLLNDWKIWRKGYGLGMTESLVSLVYLVVKSLIVAGELAMRKLKLRKK